MAQKQGWPPGLIYPAPKILKIKWLFFHDLNRSWSLGNFASSF